MDADAPRLRTDLLVHAGFVRALARAALKGDPESEDLEQDVWVAALEGAPEDPGHRRSWLAAVVRNRAVDLFRGRSRRATRERAAARPEAVDSAADVAARAETGRRLVAAVLTLEETDRTVLLLRFHEGLAPRDVAARLSVPVETVRTRTRRALDRLRRRLEEDGRGARAWAVALAPLADTHPAAGTAAVGTAAAVGGGIAVKKMALVGAALLLLVAGGVRLVTRVGDEKPVAGVAPLETARVGLEERDAALAARGGAPPAADGAKDPRRPRPVPAGPSIRGRVVDREGKGIARAWIAALPDDAGKPVRPDEVETSGVGETNFTGADGRFEVAASGAAPFFQVTAEAEGFGAKTADGVRAGSDVEIVLAPARRLVGRVLDSGGDPVAGARVTVLQLVDLLRFEREAVSGADGSYRVEGIPASGLGSGAMRVVKEGFAPLHQPNFGRGELAALGGGPDAVERTLDFVLVRGATLEGRVLGDGDGAPIEGARVVLVSIEGMQGWSRPGGASVMTPWSPRVLGETRSAADGTFRFEHVPAEGFHRIDTSNSGRRGMTMGNVGAWKEGWAWSSDEVPVSPDGASISAGVRLRPAATFAGRVVDGAKRPLAGAQVWAALSGERMDSWVPECVVGVPRSFATTAEDGTYRIEAAGMSAKRARAMVTARVKRKVDWGADRTPSVTVDAEPGRENSVPDLVIEDASPAEAPKKARLRVVDASGAPLWGARIEPAGTGFLRMQERSDREGALVVEVPPRGDGRSMTGLVRLRGYAPTAVTIPDDPSPDAEIRVVVGPSHRVAGRVLHADRSPAVGATVVVFDGSVPLADVLPREGVPITFDDGPPRPGRPSIRHAMALTGADGAFSAEDLPDGPYTVLAQAAGRGTPAAPAVGASIAAGTTDVQLVLSTPPPRPQGVVRGRVVSEADGRPVPTFNPVLVRRRDSGDPPPGPQTVISRDRSSMFFAGPRFAVEKTSIGRFEARDLEPGTYDLDVNAAGFLPARVEGVVVQGGETELAPIVLSRGLRVRGTVRREDGGSLKDLSFSLGSVGRARSRSATLLVRADGTFEGSGLEAGRWRVLASGPLPGWGLQQYLLRQGDAEVVIEDVAETRLDLVLVLAGALTIGFADPRLPPSQTPLAESVTPAQRDFGRASKLSLETADHHIVFTVDSLEGGLRPEHTWRYLLPGAYVVRLEMPGGETVDRRVDLAAGAREDVVLGVATRPK